MKISRDNSLFKPTPPEIVIGKLLPSEMMEELIANHEEEISYEENTLFDDLERKELSELLKWEKL